MCSLSGFRPPQFSEDAAWLPTWLQQCNIEQLNFEGIKKDHSTFERRIEELRFLQEGINSESPRGGECKVGQLFLSGTDYSPLSFAQSADNVVEFHLCLSQDGNTENTTLRTDTCQAESNCVIQPLENSEIPGQEDVNLRLSHYDGAVNCFPAVGLERPVHENELLRHDENVNFSEASDDAVELCIAASEALVINEVMECDSFAKPSSILESSLHVKQARLEVWKNNFSDSNHTSEIDNLSDLDDITMESVYEDVGIHLNELPGNKLSVSQVKDTFDSEYSENLKNEKSGGAGVVRGKSPDDSCTWIIEGVIDNGTLLREDLAAECLDGDTQKEAIGNPLCDLGYDIGYHNDCLRVVEAREKPHLSILATEANAPREDSNSHETNVSSFPISSCRDREKDNPPSIGQERFQSRWFGGWTSNTPVTPQNEVKYYTTERHNIRLPFACETSFLSESADAAPDENSFARYHDKGAMTASQLSIPSQNFSNCANDGMLLSQDVRSSSTSLVDPLCSAVPCSISENICSQPVMNHEDTVPPGHIATTTESERDNLQATSPSNNALDHGERTAMPTADTRVPRGEFVRQFTSLRNYSKLLPSHANLVKKDGHVKSSFLIDCNSELTFQEKTSTNHEESVKDGAELCVSQNENAIRTEVPESKAKPPQPSYSLQRALLQCQSAQKLAASKRVQFSQRETSALYKNFLEAQTSPRNGCLSSATKRSNRSSAHLESRAQNMARSLRNHLNKEKKRLLFQNMEFLLTGLSQQKEKEIEGLIRKYGGIVLSQIPSSILKGKRSLRSKSPVLPIVLGLKKIQSFKFLYGCAVNAYILKVNWLLDSIEAGVILPAKRYMILPRKINRRSDEVYTTADYKTGSLVFSNLGIMLHGKTKYFTNIATIIKHGGGQVFKTLHRMVQALEAGRFSMGLVVTDEESCASRHLKHCAMEQNIPMTSVNWIIKSLYAGELISLEERKNPRRRRAIKPQTDLDTMELSQEI